MANKKVKLTLMRSLARRNERVQATIRGLGLRHREHSAVVEITPQTQGMIDKVIDMLKIEETSV